MNLQARRLSCHKNAGRAVKPNDGPWRVRSMRRSKPLGTQCAVTDFAREASHRAFLQGVTDQLNDIAFSTCVVRACKRVLKEHIYATS